MGRPRPGVCRNSGLLHGGGERKAAICELAACTGRPGALPCRAVATRSKAPRPRCDDCYFRNNLLCALELDEPCATFRPNGPEGLQPPRQLRFAFRQERTRAVWAFPSAQDQASLHAGG